MIDRDEYKKIYGIFENILNWHFVLVKNLIQQQM